MLRYKSDAFQAIHEDALANYEVGAITREELEEYERACFVSECPDMEVAPSSSEAIPASAYAASEA
jgi:DNA-binding transcriptional regulator YiaG